MKKFLLLLFLTLSVSLFVFAQSDKDSARFELQSIDLSAGKSFLSGGYTLTVGFSSAKANTAVILKEDKMFMNHVYAMPKLKSVVGPSGGYFINVPFAGAMYKFMPTDFISTLHWFGYSFGEPGANMEIKPSFLFLINKIDIKVWKFKTYYCHVKTKVLPDKQILGVNYERQMTKRINVYTNVGYDFTNSEQLLQLGLRWSK